MKLPYSNPKLVKYEDLAKTWYVYFRYKGKVFKYTGKMGYEPNRRKRSLMGEALAEVLHDKLKNGWNPLVKDNSKQNSEYTLYEAIEFAFEKKKPNLSDKTIKGYGCFIRFMQADIPQAGYNYLEITKLERSHVKTLLEFSKNKRNWSNNAYNKYLGFMQVFLNELIEWDIIKYNPAQGMRKLSVEESTSNTPPTDKEWKAIKSFLLARDANFYNFCLMIVYTGIRPVELLRITIGMINVNSHEIILPPSITKTKFKRVVPISDHIWPIVERAASYPDNFYLFGSYRENGKGNQGKFDDFITGTTPLKRDTATKRWNKLIKTDLGIDVNMYALKHYGASVFLRSGIPIDAVRHLFGHTTVAMTERYVKDIKGIYKEQYLNAVPEI